MTRKRKRDKLTQDLTSPSPQGKAENPYAHGESRDPF
jgi:hypothetical protein